MAGVQRCGALLVQAVAEHPPQVQLGRRCVEVEKRHPMTPLPQRFGDGQPIGDIAAEWGLFAKPGNMHWSRCT